LISQPTKAAERSTMLAIGTVLAELVAATDSRLRLGRLACVVSTREVW
jgi:hypothetical protein